jgi:hypothetical protein
MGAIRTAVHAVADGPIVSPAVRSAVVLLWLSALAVGVPSQKARAQAGQAPGSHWGASMYPRTEPSVVVSFEILGFTELGKDTRSDGAPLEPDECDEAAASGGQCGTRDPYNWMDQTIGLNVIDLSFTNPLRRFHHSRSNLLITTNLVGGWVSDTITRFYQNEIIHDAIGIQHVPREDVACAGDRDPLHCGILGFGGELTYAVDSFDRGYRRFGVRRTPIFVGGGGMVSNVSSDMHVQAGLKRYELWGSAWPRLDRIVSISVSTLVRGGVLFGGWVFPHVANHYFAADGSFALHLAKYSWPVTIEFGMSGTTGMFIDAPRKKAADGREIQSGPQPRALSERFYRLRVELGEFAFETFNDSPGGKDKGPSFGAQVLYTFVPGTWERDWIARILRSIGGRK